MCGIVRYALLKNQRKMKIVESEVTGFKKSKPLGRV
jgi:hypothetical protein